MESFSVEYESSGNSCEPITSVFLRLINNDNFKLCNYELFEKFVKGVGKMFYIVDPHETTFSSVSAVPHFHYQAWPYFVLFILLENILLWLKNKPTYRLNDSLTSLSHGIFHESGRLLFRGAESYAYIYIYENWRLFDLSWKSPYTWYAAVIGVDFCYYWVHRACHEVHILWAQHQVHHSSEEFNLAVGLRQSILQNWCSFIFYLPLALVVPPTHFLTHQQFNLLYQFWIHTKAVKTLGLLELVLNTPNHHRVHHGSNLYCLDKNYGGVFIIWDRIFGTFQKEDHHEEIIYGLVVNQPSFNPLILQTFYTCHVYETFKEMQGWKNKLKAIFWGPSWIPGSPRLGSEESKIKVLPRELYDVKLPVWINLYVLIHFCFVVYGYNELMSRHMEMSALAVFLFAIYIMVSLTIIGMFFDNNIIACVFEFARCMILVTFIQKSTITSASPALLLITEVFFILSGLFWCLQSFKVLEVKFRAKEENNYSNKIL